MEAINGKTYPLWSQFVDKKQQFIGGTLQDFGDEVDRVLLGDNTLQPIGLAEIKDIKLRDNGGVSAFFEIIGDTFTCGFDVTFGGVIPGEDGWITFSGYGQHVFRIKEQQCPFKVGQYVTYDNGYSVERGRVKSLHHSRKDAVFVVYKCGDNWDFFFNYTAALTETRHLTPGWR